MEILAQRDAQSEKKRPMGLQLEAHPHRGLGGVVSGLVEEGSVAVPGPINAETPDPLSPFDETFPSELAYDLFLPSCLQPSS
jgi:hypothetical protein